MTTSTCITQSLDDSTTKIHLYSEPRKAQHIDLHGNVFEVPDFTMKQIHDAIPSHCFRPSATRGLLYSVRDYCYIAALVFVTATYVPTLPNVWLRAAAYGLYSVVAGMVMTGIWIIAHECGHGAFSKSKRLNDAVGFLLHSSLLVPYYSWKISHSHHHKATGNLQHDTVFVPHDRASWIKQKFGPDVDPMTMEDVAEDAPLLVLARCVMHQLFAWPLYMLDNLGSQEGRRGFPYYSHYWFGENSQMFKKHQLHQIFWSDVGVLVTTAVLCQAVRTYGWWTVMVYYGLPYLWLNHWIVLITYLQHTDGSLPHFAHSQWSFARGAAATIDRDFGFIDTHLFHHIVGTHVLHHLVSTIPFYHAQEATEAVKKVMGKHFNEDRKTNLLVAFWKAQRDCQFVEETKGMEGSGVYMFRNMHSGINSR